MNDNGGNTANEKRATRGSAKDEEMVDVLLESNKVEFQRERPTKATLAQMVAPPSQLKTLVALDGPLQLAKDLGNDDPINVGIVTKGFDFEEQKKEYGSNFVPPPPAPSYLLLLWDGLQDLTLLMLLIAGIVGLILGLGFEKDKSTAWVEGKPKVKNHPQCLLTNEHKKVPQSCWPLRWCSTSKLRRITARRPRSESSKSSWRTDKASFASAMGWSNPCTQEKSWLGT